eukprot:1560830-Amphidinium_carterae.1
MRRPRITPEPIYRLLAAKLPDMDARDAMRVSNSWLISWPVVECLGGEVLVPGSLKMEVFSPTWKMLTN